MTTIRQRRQHPIDYDHSAYEELRLREVKQERCPICWDRWASSLMRTEADGIRRCPDCRLSPRTEPEKAAIEKADARRIRSRQTKPQISQVPLQDTVVPWIRVMETATGTRILPATPLHLTRSGPAVQLIVKGGGFASTDTFTYSTGISDSVSPSLSGTTQWTLTLIAGGSTVPGSNHLTFNNHQYRNIFMVG